MAEFGVAVNKIDELLALLAAEGINAPQTSAQIQSNDPLVDALQRVETCLQITGETIGKDVPELDATAVAALSSAATKGVSATPFVVGGGSGGGGAAGPSGEVSAPVTSTTTTTTTATTTVADSADLVFEHDGFDPPPQELVDQFSHANLQVSRIATCHAHPDSEKLYLIDMDIGGGKTLTCVTGLQKHYNVDDLVNRHVVTILNLRNKKLAGVASECMLLAGNSDDGGAEIVLVDPPTGSVAGDRVCLQGTLPTAPPDRISDKKWAKIVKGLACEKGEAAFFGFPLRSRTGVCLCELPDGSPIH